jgi:hypothetical protein
VFSRVRKPAPRTKVRGWHASICALIQSDKNSSGAANSQLWSYFRVFTQPLKTVPFKLARLLITA